MREEEGENFEGSLSGWDVIRSWLRGVGWRGGIKDNYAFVFKLCFYCWHYCRVLHFPTLCHLPPAPATPSVWTSPHCSLCLWVTHMCSLADLFPFFHPVHLNPLPSDSCLLFHVSIAHHFILFLRSHIKVRSYGIVFLSLAYFT